MQLLRSLPDLPFADLLLAALGRAPEVGASPSGDVAVACMPSGSAIVARPAAGGSITLTASLVSGGGTLDALASIRLDLEVLQRWAELVELAAGAGLTRPGVDAVIGAVRRVRFDPTVDRDDRVAETALFVARANEIDLGDGGDDSPGAALVSLALALHELMIAGRQVLDAFASVVPEVTL